MEDALALQAVVVSSQYGACLNPCCNGRCTRTLDQNSQLAEGELVS